MDCDLLNKLSMDEGRSYSNYHKDAGQEHYRLLKHMCKGVNIAIDVGTYWGLSALAMSSAKEVYSFDVAKLRHKTIDFPTNIKFSLDPVLDNPDLLRKADVILLDTYHDGEFESLFYQTLLEIDYKGILLLDDIFLNDAMKRFWNSIETDKQDITHLGHYTGTGKVVFK